MCELNKNYRDKLKQDGYFVPSSSRTISDILKELGYVTQRRKADRFHLVLPDPMTEWEMDFGEIRLNEYEKLAFFLVMDRGTSRVVYLEGSAGYDQKRETGGNRRVIRLIH